MLLDVIALLPLLMAPMAAAQQGTTYYFTGAIFVPSNGQNPTAAVPAQCPADHPVSCTNLQQPYYCCPASNTCAWSNSQVACCPEGVTCTGAVGGGGGYQPTSWYQTPSTTTVYTQPPAPATTIVVAGGGGGVATVYTTPYQQGGYCSTLYEVGPGLPTTAAGECGTVLVESPAAAARTTAGGDSRWITITLLLVGLWSLGGLLLVGR